MVLHSGISSRSRATLKAVNLDPDAYMLKELKAKTQTTEVTSYTLSV